MYINRNGLNIPGLNLHANWFGIFLWFGVPLGSALFGTVSVGAIMLVFFTIIFLGTAISGKVGEFVGRTCLKLPDAYVDSLSSGFACFGFLFFPPFAAWLANANLGTEFEISSLSAHLLWACIGGFTFSCVSLFGSEN